MGMGFNIIRMENIKDTGKMIKLMGKGLFNIMKEMFTLVIGKMIKYMDMDFIKIKMV